MSDVGNNLEQQERLSTYTVNKKCKMEKNKLSRINLYIVLLTCLTVLFIKRCVPVVDFRDDTDEIEKVLFTTGAFDF